MNAIELVRRASRKANLWRKRKLIDDAVTELCSKIDRTEFDLRFLHHLDGTSRSRKFVLIDRWLRDAVVRFCAYGFDSLPVGAKVCDLGCGAGYFLMVCEYFGHQADGLDLDCDPIYNEMIQFFALNRIIYRIEPFTPLSVLGDTKYDAITAFMTCFNRYSDGRPWQEDEWQFFLGDLRERLNLGGRVIVKFNRNHKEDVLYPAEVKAMIVGLDAFRARFYGDNLELTAL